MERMKFLRMLLLTMGWLCIIWLFVINVGFYQYKLTIPLGTLISGYVMSGSFLYMSWEYFRTLRYIEWAAREIARLEAILSAK